ncbi:hypothetical protein KAFR_0D03870 [Kazachstania africana CBS 2517]|uniref:HMA domain-containing protein n=1 Tax=Kazachstania africana (strain ATCC 22294 / BCRC 22015 / CBS 2517 / CECT 1963 / NBRC 1671 / NRRL Y-8276) TaxID=1071382 RepID=H2AUI5_KAZAF|nr:hypothetical protein KAFR_0D03870 [Kazachstania africana CBS 2517]CCF58035.1 hypothetical protein KAFR_0D03870 [Kazachstania africana CBS 2517]
MIYCYHFNVVMTCSGCSDAIHRSLSKLGPEVTDIDISLENQYVEVFTTLPYEFILDRIERTGKEVLSGGLKTSE